MTTPIDRTIHDLEYYQQLIKNGSATDIMRTQRPPAPWHLKPWYIRYEHPGYGFTAEMAEKEQTKIEAAGIAFKKEHPLLYDAWSKVFEGFDVALAEVIKLEEAHKKERKVSSSSVTEAIQSFRKVAENFDTKAETLDKLSFDAKDTAHPCKSTFVTVNICQVAAQISEGFSHILYDLNNLVKDAVGEPKPHPTAPLTVSSQHEALVAIQAHIHNMMHASFHLHRVTMTAVSAAERANGDCVEIDEQYDSA
jgi:hypothetical protein